MVQSGAWSSLLELEAVSERVERVEPQHTLYFVIRARRLVPRPLNRSFNDIERTRGTPLPSAVFFGAKVVHALLVALLLVVITVTFGHVLYSAEVPTGISLVQFLAMSVVGAASFCALGFAITTVIPNSDAAAPIVNATILPLLFLSGVFIPIGDNAPAWITWIARIFPVKHFADGIQAGFLGTVFHWSDVLIVGLWGLGALLVTLRFFSWEPRN
jgi:ABC-2 type transport system permease protein